MGNKILNSLKRGIVRFFNFLKRKDAEELDKPLILGTRGKQIVVLVFVVALSCYVGTFLLKYTVLDGDMWRVMANDQHMTSLMIKAKRGSILDRNGTVLAQSSTVWDIIVSPKAVYEANEEEKKQYAKDKEKWEKSDDPEKDATFPAYIELNERIADGLCAVLPDIDREKLIAACTGNEALKYEHYIVKRKVEKPETLLINDFLTENNIRGDCAYPEESSKRYYPNENLAASIIGFTNFDGEGVYGLEAYYDDYLRGMDGKAVYTKNGRGQATDEGNDFINPAIDGYSLVLTLDEVLQHYLEKNLELCVSQHSVINRACGIIMDCNTGAVLAMATSPGFDPNSPSTLASAYDIARLEELTASGADEKEIDELNAVMREGQWKNKAITELYFPGSVFKTVTCAAALEEEVVDENSSFSCAGYADVAGTHIECWNPGGHGVLNLQQAITKSCNPSFIAIGQALGKDKFCDYFEAFGFTEPTRIDLPGESRCLYMSRDRMGPVELASSAFGQTNKVTPLQMCTAMCAIVNGGYLVTPYLCDKILDSDGNVVETTPVKIKRQVISEETSLKMRGILENVVQSNGGTNAYIEGYRIGGKSGTTEKIDERNAARKKDPDAPMTYVPSFGAFAPADDPQIVMLVMADTPTGANYYGSAVAAPVVSAVFKEGLPHLGIYPTYTAEEQAKMDAVVPYVLGSQSMKAEAVLMGAGFDVRIVGDPASTENVTTQIPASGSTAPKGSTVVLYVGSDYEVETGVVPNVIGCTVTQANDIIVNAGFNIKITGGAAENVNAVATMQSVADGTVYNKGNVIEVTFQANQYGD